MCKNSFRYEDIEILKILDEHKYCYELFSAENSLLISCREYLIKIFVFDLAICIHYYKRRRFVFCNTICCKTHPKDCKIIRCYPRYRKSLIKAKSGFPVFII